MPDGIGNQPAAEAPDAGQLEDIADLGAHAVEQASDEEQQVAANEDGSDSDQDDAEEEGAGYPVGLPFLRRALHNLTSSCKVGRVCKASVKHAAMNIYQHDMLVAILPVNRH
jgi:hypothetical protein